MKKKRCSFFYFFGYLILLMLIWVTVFNYSVWAKDTACLSTLWPHETSDLAPDPKLIFGRLPNGFRYVLMENKEPKDRVSLHLNIQAGSLYERDEQQGLAHYLEHMLFNGTEHFPPGELIKYFQSIGMAFGADVNGHTGFAETVYDVVLPKGDQKNLEKGLLVIRDYARGALLLKEEIDRERGIILAEKRTRDSVEYRTYVESMKFLFAGAKIAQRFPIGTEEVIQAANRELLKDYYDTWYRPENMILVMVGDFDPQIAEPIIKSKFSKLTAAAPVHDCPYMGKVAHTGKKAFYHYEKEAGSTRTSIHVLWNTQPKSDSLDNQKAFLTQYIADRILNNRLDAMREKPDTPFTSAMIYSGFFLNHFGYAKLATQSAPENWKKALTLLEQFLRRAIQFGFTKSELDRVKKDMLADMEDSVLKKETRHSDELSSSIIDYLNENKVFQSPDQEKKLYAPFIESLTLEQVHQAFIKVWDHPHRLIVLAGNAQIEDPQNPETVIQSVLEASEKTEVKPPEKKESVVFPYLPEPETFGKIKQYQEISDLGIEWMDFENGLRLNLKKTDFKKNEVLVNIVFGDGRKSEPLPGLAMLTESVLNQSGLRKLSKNELDKALAGKNTGVQFHINENRFLLSGNTVSDEVPLLFQLLYACLMDPGYRQDAYLLSMRQFEQMYKQMSHAIDATMELSGERFLAGGDSRFGMPSYDAVKKLSLSQVQDWIESIRKCELEISVVGDFDPEAVKKLASRYFASLPKQKKLEEKKESLTFPAGRQLEIDVETSIRKGIVVIAWPTEDFSNIYRVRRLSALGHLFTDRLREEIREKLGITYSQYAYNDSSRTYQGYGLFRSVFLIDPNMSEKVIQEVKQMAVDLAKNGTTQEELKRTIDPILTGIKDMMRTNKYWLNTVLTDSVNRPEQLLWCRSIQEDYASITAKDVFEMAKTYLKNEKAAIIIIRPSHSK